ncbi:MAG: restriction endonuclease subunit S [Patescibacteria group bacterium]
MAIHSIILKSELEGNLRLDAEYYQPEYLNLEKRFDSLKTKVIDEISESVISFGAYSLTSYIEWQKSGVPYINVGDIHNGYINLDNVKYISEKVNEILKKSQVKNGQVLLTMAGTIGNAAVAHNFLKIANANQAIAKIKLLSNFSPYYLTAFLNSKYGLLQTQRQIVSSVQSNIFLGTIKQFKVPIFDNKIMESIGDVYKSFLDELENSKLLYQEAEDLLLEELGLKDFESENKFFSIVNLSDVKNANRFDAEYFQGEYNKLNKKISNYKVNKLEYFVKNYSTGFPFKSENYQEIGIPLIRINNIKRGYLDLNDTAYLSENDYQLSPKDTAKTGDIVLSMSGTIGMSAVIPDNISKCSINQRILRITPKEIDKDYFVFLLNSVIGLYQLEQIGTGGVQINISYKDIKNILIPVLPQKTQQKIADLVQKSHEARKKAKELLEEAKQKVENLIENK